jgi:F0F1-type ATP synthase assembly protein I
MDKSSKEERRWTEQAMEWLPLVWVLPVMTVVGWGIGRVLDHLLATDFLYLVFLLLGIGAGLWLLLRAVNRLNRES